MALAFGGGVRPELGRTDYSAIARGSEIAAQLSAQGSQMVGQGLAKALEGAGKAIANYQEKKELKEFKTQARSAIAEYAKKYPDIFEKTNFSPDVLDDPAKSDILIKSFSEKGDYRDGFANLSNFIREDIKNRNAEREKKEQGAAIGRALTARGDSEMASAINQGVPFSGLAGLSTAQPPLSMEERAARLAEAGVPPTAIPQILNSFNSGRELDFKINQPPEVIPKTPEEAYAAANLTPNTGKINFVNGRYVALPLTQAEQNANAKFEQDRLDAIKKGDADKANLIERAQSKKRELENTLALIDQSIALASSGGIGGGAGGPIAGSLPVRTLGAMATGVPILGPIARALGSDAAVRQKALYDTIRSRFTFDKVQELKELSGSTGLGQTSNLEFTALGDSVGQIDSTLPEDLQLASLKNIRKTVMNLLGKDSDTPGAGNPNMTKEDEALFKKYTPEEQKTRERGRGRR
jgi:hypothetical protein